MPRKLKKRVLVAGAGLGGFAAALTALEGGAEVLLIDKAPSVGGTTLLSGGLTWTHSDLEAMGDAIPRGNPVLHGLLHSRIDEGREWLRRLGVEFEPEEGVYGYGWGARLDPQQAIRTLEHSFQNSGGTLRCDTALNRLLLADGRVVGAEVVMADGSTSQLDSDCVILATGGFQGNPELLCRYVVPSAANLHLRASPWSTGDGLIAATDAGAALTPGMETFYGHALPSEPAHFGPGSFRDASQSYGAKTVAINMHGLRFVDESAGTGEEELNQHLSRQAGGRGFYVFDQRLAEAESRPGRRIIRVAADWARDHGAPYVMAESIEELSAGLEAHGVPREAFLKTIQQFNAACRTGLATSGLFPPRTRAQTPIEDPPFFAVGVQASITFTMGGIAVDSRGRVLRRSASTSPIAQSTTDLRDHREVHIPGLYAVGCDVGNISHGGYAGGLSAALVLGRIAGEDASSEPR